MQAPIRARLDDFNDVPSQLKGDPPSIVTLDEFAAIHEPGAAALLGSSDESALIPEGGDIMIYGDGGAGKTTLTIDIAFHLAAGMDWSGIPVPRPARSLLIENEGPRPLFRRKLRRKLEKWEGGEIGDRLLVHEAPWASLRMNEQHERDLLAATIRQFDVDMVIAGPLTRIGMSEAGTLQQVADFMLLVAEVRQLSSPRVAFMLVHHENKGGQVSGAWEGSGDTLLHVQAQGHGSTRLYIQKARWASDMHGQAIQLAWAAGESFTVVDKPVVDDETIVEEILEAARKAPGGSWRDLREHITGNYERASKLRSKLIKAGVLVNTGTEKRMALWHRDDPAAMLQTQVVPDSEPPWNHLSATPGESAKVFSGSTRFPFRGTGNLGTTSVPLDVSPNGDLGDPDPDRPESVTKSGAFDDTQPDPDEEPL